MITSGYKDIHMRFCYAFDIQIGSKIEVFGWKPFEVREEGMFIEGRLVPTDLVYSRIMENGLIESGEIKTFEDVHTRFCHSFDIPIGGEIRIPCWGDYEVREEGMFERGVSPVKNLACLNLMIMRKGFIILKERNYEED